MNKKLRLFVIIALVIQIVLPLYLLYTHYSDHNYAMAESPMFKFRLESIDVYEIYDIYDVYVDNNIPWRKYVNEMINEIKPFE